LTFIYDMPFETWGDLFKSIRFLMQSKPRTFHFHKLQILDGSLLCEQSENYFDEVYYDKHKINKFRKRNTIEKVNVFFKDTFFFILNKLSAFSDLNIF
jgi:hypothetical protein